MNLVSFGISLAELGKQNKIVIPREEFSMEYFVAAAVWSDFRWKAEFAQRRELLWVGIGLVLGAVVNVYLWSSNQSHAAKMLAGFFSIGAVVMGWLLIWHAVEEISKARKLHKEWLAYRPLLQTPAATRVVHLSKFDQALLEREADELVKLLYAQAR